MDARDVYKLPPKEFVRLADRGLLHKLATGYYAIVPPGSTDRAWLPSLEGAAFGIGAADYGADGAVLMGLSAARIHGAIPRALGVAVVAVDANRRAVTLVDREACLVFVRRATDRLDADRVTLDLGPALVSTVEQTLLDLAHRPSLGGVATEAHAAVLALWPRADPARLGQLAAEQRLASALARARVWRDG